MRLSVAGPSPSVLVHEALPWSMSVLFPFLWAYWSGAPIGVWGLIGLVVLMLASWEAGLVFHVACGSSHLIRRSFPIIFATGLPLVSILLFLVKLTLGWSLSTTAVLLVIGGAILLAWYWERASHWEYDRQWAWVGSTATLLSFLAGTLWSMHSLPVRVDVPGGLQSRMFVEDFAHTVHVLPLLGPGTPFAFGSPYFCGEPWAFYHLASHVFPAFVSEWAGVSLATMIGGIWYAMGISLVGMGATLFTSTLWGNRHGLWGAVLVALLPDPTFWSWQMLPFSFTQNLEATVAAGMGVAVGGVACSLVLRGSLRQSSAVTAAGFFLALCLFFIRANFLFCVLPTCTILLLIARQRGPTGWTWRVLSLLVVLGILGFFAGKQLQSAPTTQLGWRGGEPFAVWASHVLMDQSVWMDLVPEPNEVSIVESILRRGVYLLLGGFQGGLYVALLVGVLGQLRGSFRTGMLLLPIALLGLFIFVGLFALPNQNGDPFEIPHRPFVWYYFALASWTAGGLGRVVGWLGLRSSTIGLSVALMAIAPAYWLGREPRMPSQAEEHFIPRGLLEVAQELAQRTSRTEPFVDSKSDPILMSTALTERPTFVCWRQGYFIPGQKAVYDVRANRWRELDRLLKAHTRKELLRWSNEQAVRWVILHPETKVDWPIETYQSPVFQSQGYRLVDLRAGVDEAELPKRLAVKLSP